MARPHAAVRALALSGLWALAACAPCEYDNGIVRGELTGLDGLGLEGGHVQLVPGTGEARQVSVFSDGLFEASVGAGSWEVIGWNADESCFSEITAIDVEPCDEVVTDLVIVDCF